MIRVLIADDSPTVRRLVRAILDSDPEVKVVGEARNGSEAIELCLSLVPDIITMDIQMPQMDGYEAIRHIMDVNPCPIVVLTSTESDQELNITYKGIEAGALMVIKKPRGILGTDPEAKNLIAQVKSMAGVKVVRRRLARAASSPNMSSAPVRAREEDGSPKIIAIGASTGGPPALKVILDHLGGAPVPVPIAIVQHISQGFVKGMARWLHDTTPLSVKVTNDGETLRPGTVYLANDNRHLTLGIGGQAQLIDSGSIDGHRPSATALFTSIAHYYGRSAIGVVLTGMGRDGASGLKRLREAGGYTIAQDEESSVVFGMPQQAIALGAANEVLPLDRIGQRLKELISRSQ